MPRYQVSLWRVASSVTPDVVQVVRTSNIEEAIEVLVKAKDMPYASAAKVVSVNKHGQPIPSVEEWQWHLRCKISGEFSSS